MLVLTYCCTTLACVQYFAICVSEQKILGTKVDKKRRNVDEEGWESAAPNSQQKTQKRQETGITTDATRDKTGRPTIKHLTMWRHTVRYKIFSLWEATGLPCPCPTSTLSCQQEHSCSDSSSTGPKLSAPS